MMNGNTGKAVKPEIHSPEARGVNSAIWVLERGGHESQGTSPRPESPVNLSWVLAPNVRNCQTKTTPRVERKDLLEAQTARLPPSGSEYSSLVGMGSGLYRRGYTVKEGGVSPREQPDR
jgi:hypothetical protein